MEQQSCTHLNKQRIPNSKHHQQPCFPHLPFYTISQLLQDSLPRPLCDEGLQFGQQDVLVACALKVGACLLQREEGRVADVAGDAEQQVAVVIVDLVQEHAVGDNLQREVFLLRLLGSLLQLVLVGALDLGVLAAVVVAVRVFVAGVGCLQLPTDLAVDAEAREEALRERAHGMLPVLLLLDRPDVVVDNLLADGRPPRPVLGNVPARLELALEVCSRADAFHEVELPQKVGQIKTVAGIAAPRSAHPAHIHHVVHQLIAEDVHGGVVCRSHARTLAASNNSSSCPRRVTYTLTYTLPHALTLARSHQTLRLESERGKELSLLVWPHNLRRPQPLCSP
eukprot:m.85241 g.85241  ORF g.85241 m.85241 type:complete len:338 (+) comp15047_c1_seq3:697-1710(+)